MASYSAITENNLYHPESPLGNRKYTSRKEIPASENNAWTLPDNYRNPKTKTTNDSIFNISTAYNNNNKIIKSEDNYRTSNLNLSDELNKGDKDKFKPTVPNINNNSSENVRTRSNSLKNSLPKLLCLKRPSTLPSEKLSISLIDKSDLLKKEIEIAQKPTNSEMRQKNRASFHQDVEEALNSLLWQPYEYQNKQQKTSYSSSSCSSSISSYDLEDYQNNGLESSSGNRGNVGDLNATTEMVNNPAQDYKNLFHEWETRVKSCDYQTPRTASRLNMNATIENSEIDSSFDTIVKCVHAVSSSAAVGGEPNYCGRTSLYGSDAFCDNFSEMPVEVSTNNQLPHSENLLNISTPLTNNGLITARSTNNNGVTIHQNNVARNSLPPFNNSEPNFNKSTSSNNLSNANVVGLPTHSRYASVPSSTNGTRAQTNNIAYNHTRHISEPAREFRFTNQQNQNQNSLVPPVNHQRNSHLEQNNVLVPTHLRSASVPKSMQILQQKTDASTTSPPRTNSTNNNQKVPSINVSNVNVNFYRAVPVNVVSSVPTIHCLNTLSNEGNNVSNVQIMPLGSTPQQFNNNQNKFQINQQVIQNFNTNGTQTPFNQLNQNKFQINQPISTSISNQSPNKFQINNSLQPQILLNSSSNANQQFSSASSQINTATLVPSFSTAGLSGTTQVTVHNSQTPTHSIQIPSNSHTHVQTRSNVNNSTTTEVRARTFTSTEAQTDEISVCPPAEQTNRELRRREKRERRHQRRLNNSNHRHSNENNTQVNDRLPDILNSHLPPPYTPVSPQSASVVPPPPPANLVPPPQVVPGPIVTGVPGVPPTHGAVLQTVVSNNVVPGALVPFPPPGSVIPGQVPLVQGGTPVAVQVPPPTGFRFPFPPTGFRRGRFSEEPPKGCCGLLSWKPGSLRWFIALIALIAVCCVLVGTALGAMRPAGRDHLTVSLLMIGVGIVLVTVSGVAWRLTSHDSSTCRSMLGLGSTESVDVCTRRFVPRLPPSYGRPHHPYAAMMYPEFQYRPPPPSYQASMQEYRLRLLLLDRGNTPQIQAGIQNAVSPPPTYRSHAGSLLRAPLSSRRDVSQSEYSCPPSYRSQTSSIRPQNATNNSVLHSRDASLSLSESNNGGSVVNVVNILGSTEESIALDNITLDSLKMEPTEAEMNTLRMLLRDSSDELEGSKDGNLVTIVQTDDTSPVIVTVSGNSQIDTSASTVQITEIPSEMEILAHL